MFGFKSEQFSIVICGFERNIDIYLFGREDQNGLLPTIISVIVKVIN